jgi:AraC family transcriptional regulator of adaptative response/methylated-DNA-[protein]-cysteine methyltransferase
MTTQPDTNYDRIAQAIEYIRQHFKEQPALDTIAKEIGVSPFHFQRLFTEWAGVSPKQFLQYLNTDYAKRLLRNDQATLLDAAIDAGLSGTGRLHDLFVRIEGMTPGEYKNGGEHLRINYRFAQTPFGPVIIASTEKGVCHIAFGESDSCALAELETRFPNAQYDLQQDRHQANALRVFESDWSRPDQVRLHLKGTDFQIKVWEALLNIPSGELVSYSDIAQKVGRPQASRAAGTAIGSNPVAFVIPCHRVIRANGEIGEYMWGSTRKSAIIGWEASRMGTGRQT